MLVIFDCDGVLVDSEHIATKSSVETLNEMGFPITETDYKKRFLGRPENEIYASIKELSKIRQIELPEDIFELMETSLQAEFAKKLKAVEGMRDLVKGVTLPKCVASSSCHKMLNLKLTLSGFSELFVPHIFSAEDVKKGKPEPDLFLYAAREMKHMPQDCLVIEDSPAGVEAGLAAEMTVLAFLGGSHQTETSKKALKDSNCHHVAENVDSLSKFITEWALYKNIA